jgi:hypothetical protein
METEISMKNTKAEILEALNEARVRAEAAEKGKLNPAKVEKEKVEKKAVESAAAAVNENIFSAELISKFKDLQTAIAAEEARLQELYGASSELQKLALIIEAGRERGESIDVENRAKIAAAEEKLETLQVEYIQKNAQLKEEYDEAAKRLKTEREREAEEYQYNLNREREKDENAWADECSTREAALNKKEEQAQAILAAAEERADHIKSLEAKVAEIPALIDAQTKAATDATTAELSQAHTHKTALSEKDFENTIARASDKIAYLEKELEATGKLNISLQNKLDKAYAEIRELATKTVESASGVKIIGGGE